MTARSRASLMRIGILLLAALVLLMSCAWWFGGCRSESEKSYKQIRVTRGDLNVTVLTTGIVQPENRLQIKPPIAGRVEEVLVDEGQRVKKGQTLVLMSSVERAALLDAARARGSEEYARWQSFYRAAPILAPIDGTIILRSVEPGQSFTTQEAVLTMSDRLTVKAQVDETDIAQIKLQQPAQVILDAYPQQPIAAHVDKIAYDATTVNNVTTYIVDVLPEETPEFMRSGMTANVRFEIASKQNVLLLPTSAIRNAGDQPVVLVPANSRLGTPEEQAITTGLTNGKEVEILSGLNEGEVVLQVQPRKKSTNGSSDTSTPLMPKPPRPPR